MNTKTTAPPRPLTPRVQAALRFVDTNRTTKKERWGVGLSVLDDKTKKPPLVYRKAHAIEKVLKEMPVEIRSQ